jgi:hypothetical protein
MTIHQVDNDDDAWPLPSDAIASEAPPRYGGAMQWHALEHDDVVASWEAAVIDACAARGAARRAGGADAERRAQRARATQLSSRSRRIALLNETLVRGAAMARTTLHASGFARCDAGDVRGATCALDAAERLASVLNDTATTPLLMNTAPDLLADELAALGGTRQALLVAVVQQFLLTPCARAIAPLLRSSTQTNSADRDDALVHDGIGAERPAARPRRCALSLRLVEQTLRAIVLELCGALDAYVFDTLWTAQPALTAPQQLGVDLGSSASPHGRIHSTVAIAQLFAQSARFERTVLTVGDRTQTFSARHHFTRRRSTGAQRIARRACQHVVQQICQNC